MNKTVAHELWICYYNWIHAVDVLQQAVISISYLSSLFHSRRWSKWICFWVAFLRV